MPSSFTTKGCLGCRCQVEERRFWLALSGKALEQLNIGMAVRVYRALGDAGMTQALEQIVNIEDKNLLAGHVNMLFQDYSKAQESFGFNKAKNGFEMRRDLLHWDHALKLAATISPGEVAFISIEYAQQLEFKGQHGMALNNYETAMSELDQALKRINMNLDTKTDNALLEDELEMSGLNLKNTKTLVWGVLQE